MRTHRIEQDEAWKYVNEKTHTREEADSISQGKVAAARRRHQ